MATIFYNQHSLSLQPVDIKITVRNNDAFVVKPEKIVNGFGFGIDQDNHQAGEVEGGVIQERSRQDQSSITDLNERQLKQ